MTVTVRLFAILREKAGFSETTLQVSPGMTIADAVNQLCSNFPELVKFQSRIAYAVNERFSPATTQLHDGDELALIPPVSGGTTDDWLDLLNAPLNIAQATDFVASPKA